MTAQSFKTFILITGASAGIGKALALQLAKKRNNLLLVSLPDTGLAELQQKLVQVYHIAVHIFEGNLTDAGMPEKIWRWCCENDFRISGLINNAGFGNLEYFHHTHVTMLTSMMQLNNSAMVLLTHLFIPELKKFNSSFIMNVGSLASFLPIPRKSVYAATKSFVYAFSQALHVELQEHHIHVCCLCPGGTLTDRVKIEMRRNKLNRSQFCQTPEQVASYAIDGLENKKFRIIPGWKNQLVYSLSQLLPDFIKMMIIQFVFKNNANRTEARRLPVPRSYIKSFAMISR